MPSGTFHVATARGSSRAVHLEVGRDNRAAKALYERFGFRGNDRQLLTMRLPSDPTRS